MFGLNLVVNRGKTIFICDTSVIEYPDANNSQKWQNQLHGFKTFWFRSKNCFYPIQLLVNQQQIEPKD